VLAPSKATVAIPDEIARRRAAPRKGRPTAADAHEVSRRILDAATQCFFSKGYEATAMDAIAASARVSKMTLYGRFPSKEILLRAVVEDRAAAWSKAASEQNWLLGTTLEDRLKHHLTVVMTWGMSEEIRAFDRLLANAPPEVARPLNEVRYSLIVDALANEIIHFTAADGQPARDPRQVAFDLMSMVSGWLRIQIAMREVSKSEAIAYGHHAVDVVMAARLAW
jgi:TetR/AcrR family transcriptional regulator, mexJK operon transcriptional repressor